MPQLALSEGTIAIIVATIAAVPATLAALAAYRKGKQTAERVTPPTARDERLPATAKMIEQIYSRFDPRGHAADPRCP